MPHQPPDPPPDAPLDAPKPRPQHALGAEPAHAWLDETTPMLRPSVTIRVEYRQLGTGPDSVEVQWDAGTVEPSATELCTVLAALIPTRRED